MNLAFLPSVGCFDSTVHHENGEEKCERRIVLTSKISRHGSAVIFSSVTLFRQFLEMFKLSSIGSVCVSRRQFNAKAVVVPSPWALQSREIQTGVSERFRLSSSV